MSPRLGDFHAYLLLWLTLLLDGELTGRAGNQSRVYDLGAVACRGLHVRHVRERAAEVLEAARRTLPAWGFDPAALEAFARRVATRRVPADDILADWKRDRSLPAVLRRLTGLQREAPTAATHLANEPALVA
jgi:hypothetical protein